MIAVESVSLFIVVFFVSGAFNLELLVHRNCCVCHVKVFIKSATDHHEKPYKSQLEEYQILVLHLYFLAISLAGLLNTPAHCVLS